MSEDTGTLKKWMDTATLVIIAAGLGIAIDQACEIRKSIDAADASTNFSTWNSTAQQWLEMDSMFLQYPELRKFIFEGVPAPSDVKKLEQANAAANKVLDFVDNAITIESYAKKAKQSTASQNILNQDTWDNYFAEIFSKSPMICDIVKGHEKSYFCDTVRMAQMNCANKWKSDIVCK
ncbi:MAG TPA: hypothetical protein VE863_13580 [Pyrinomonadaceae bacterium]|nr:hypothetical protein [Pyrinomonadaceae bacterium]